MRTNLQHLDKIKVAAVSYLNTKPLLYGVKRSPALLSQMELIEDFPSKIGKMLVDNEVDLGLIPVAYIPQLKDWKIVSNYCIGSVGPVETVCLFSEVPVEQIETVILDYQSFSSINLCKVIFAHFWKKKVTYQKATPGYIDQIKGTTAGVIIGDRVFEQKYGLHPQKYIYDLAEVWTSFTGLPFMMAAWIANKPLPAAFIHDFDLANKVGLDNLAAVSKENPYGYFDLETYYREKISYQVTEDKMKALDLFLNLMKQTETETEIQDTSN
ncbi:chorismate dehydratase [Arachidicoccus rhizosphaerae]|uniref:Chorismate dehydratase n=1 Tax=Arachidicoccus rhizosphaerae TaxID=551991 RepID=A0A1H3YX48_9BACT|nr:chorismate dehydratase [Arachidicoccus rhizosphaerae]